MSDARMDSKSLSVQYSAVTCAAQMEEKVMREWKGSPSVLVVGVVLAWYSVRPGREYLPFGKRLNQRSRDVESCDTRACRSCSDAIVIAVAVAARFGMFDVQMEDEVAMMMS